MSGPKIGNADSARSRLMRFCERIVEWNGAYPQRVTLFAEDYDALQGILNDEPVEIVRGPSISEYRP